ncbi:helix-turn-helix transcriptional regulator [Aulosira sp. FACHB-615]|nr:helix-turn-helix transcriptional regulator [Aulosira sp. FACHB-615]
MSTSSGTSKEYIMLELDLITTVAWKPAFGEKLKQMRGKVSRRSLAEEIQAQFDYRVSQQYIQLLENPNMPKAPQNVSFQLLRYICQVLGHDVQEIFGSPKIISQ